MAHICFFLWFDVGNCCDYPISTFGEVLAFVIVITTRGVIIVTLAVVIALFRAGGKLCLLFGVLSFSLRLYNGLAVLVLDELGKSRSEILNESMSEKTLVGLHFVVGELSDLIMGLSVVLN